MRKPTVAAAFVWLTAMACTPAHAGIVEIGTRTVELFAAGAAFGEAGAYEKISGVARGELDPADPRNRVIVNLDKAPRNAQGKVEYQVEWMILRPADASRRNGKLIYDVTNRGRKFLMHWVMDAPAQAVSAVNDPRTAADAGNALFLRQGYTIVWSGWDPDAPRSNAGIAMTVPAAAGISRLVRDELVNGTRGPLRDTLRLTFSAASTDTARATLTVRRHEGDARITIPSSGWAFVNPQEIRLLPQGTKPVPGSLYELRYEARDPKVTGIGFAATRDLVSFFRHEIGDRQFEVNPARRGFTQAYAIGISQSGRYLRDHVHLGFNQDEGGRKVFDGVLAHISGVGGVFMNDTFAQPARTNTQHEDHTYPENRFPFSAAASVDPLTGRRGRLLRGDGFDPLWIEVNTSTEYWQKSASLLHTDPQGTRDLEVPATARVYLVAGTQHAGRVGLQPDLGPCANPRNPHNPSPVLRALMVALDQWASRGVAPPPSRVPRIADGTLVPVAALGFPKVPGMTVADRINELAVFDDWTDPVRRASPYRARVPAVGADGNERAGIRLPDVAVPLATLTGWNVYKEPFPAGALCDRDGSSVPLPATEQERAARSDPRPSLQALYRDHADYVRKVGEHANTLVRERLLLEEDAARYIEAARRPEVARRFGG